MRPLLNFTPTGPVEGMSDDELRQAYTVGMTAFLRRRAELTTRLVELRGDGRVHGLIYQTAQADPAIVAAEEALRQAGADPRGRLRWLEKFDPTSPDIPGLQAAVPAYEALEQACANARAANAALVALEAEAWSIKVDRATLNEELPEERFARQAPNELRRRGKPLVPPGGPP